MDVVGGLAAVVQLAQVAGSLANTTRKLCQRLRDAPDRIQASYVRLAQIDSELKQKESAFVNSHALLISPATRHECQIILADARSCVEGLMKILAAFDGSLKARSRWALKTYKEVEEIATRLEGVDQRLSALRETVTFHGMSRLLEALGFLHADVGEVKLLLSPPLVGVVPASVGAPSQTVLGPPKKPRARRRLKSPPAAFAILGFEWQWTASARGDANGIDLSISVTSPLAYVVGGQALMLHLSLQTLPGRQWGYGLDGSTCAAVRIVSSNQPFMAACRRGDVVDASRMLASGEGRISDIDERKWTPLAEAIANGRTNVIALLLDHNADVNGFIGQKQTLPLQWAVWQKQLESTRLLIARGASQDHINGLGWNTTFFCWPRLRHGERCMSDFLQVLDEDMYQDLDVADTEGWTVLHRVSAYGQPAEVESLIKLGADPRQEASPLGWNAMHHAVFHGNHATFDVLLHHFGDRALHLTDARGWTLLHIAASAGHDAIVRRLLELGADPGALSDPYSSHMPYVLFGRACTVQEVAAAQSPKTEMQYLQALRDAGGIQALTPLPAIPTSPVRQGWLQRFFRTRHNLMLPLLGAVLLTTMIVLMYGVSGSRWSGSASGRALLERKGRTWRCEVDAMARS
ncbi:hypothetical protein LTR73_002784 [Friedmanniomyces endolithicus]|nr:hypothetical protein LTR73_002784 [Friedmanniomyces endolithicus]